MAISDAVALNTEGLSIEECNFFYEIENISLDSRICDYLRAHFPPHDWSSNTDVVVSLCCLVTYFPQACSSIDDDDGCEEWEELGGTINFPIGCRVIHHLR